MRYQPNIQQATESICAHLGFSVTGTKRVNGEHTIFTYRHPSSNKLLATADKILIGAQDLFEQASTMDSFVFSNGFAEAYYITYW